MAKPVTFRVDRREFDRTLAVYRKYSKKELPRICNTKAMFIARNAVNLTKRANKAMIEATLGRFVKVKGIKKKLLILKNSRDYDAPLAAILVNKRRGPGRGLYGQEMREAVRRMMAARVRSIAFLASGWLPAIKRLIALSDKKGAPKQDRSVKQVGVDKGYAIPAKEGFWNVQAEIANTASGNTPFSAGGQNGLARFGGPALQEGFNMEERSMRVYIENKLRGAAKEAGIKTN